MKSFKQFINEESFYLDGVKFNFSHHFLDRIPIRSKIKKKEDIINALSSFNEAIDVDGFMQLIKKIRAKLKDIPERGEFLFYSKSLGQGLVAAWDAFKNKLTFITFLPAERHQSKTGTEEIQLEKRYINKNTILID